MTKEELLKLAIDAGAVPVNRAHQHLEPVWWSVTAEDLGRFAALVATAERDACAKVCQAVINSGEYNGHQQYAAAACRNEIAMRSNAGSNGPSGVATKVRVD